MDSIYLMGLMGSGKTSWGKKLAQHLNLEFIDLDLLIEEGERKTITEFFERDGEAKFRQLETSYLKTLTEKKDLVIALGGGTPCFNDNISTINKSGNSFYLKTDVNVIVERLVKDHSNRPLIKNKSEDELARFFEAQLKERQVFYEQANYIVEMNRYNEEELLHFLKSKIG